MSKVTDNAADNMRTKYQEIRSDEDPTCWAAFAYDGKLLEEEGKSGDDLADFLECCQDDNRVFGYLRFETGDEMSRRAKFALITWIGPAVGALKKAAVSTDKAFVKEIWKQFGKEFLSDEKKDLNLDKIKADLEKSSGAAYGTGK